MKKITPKIQENWEYATWEGSKKAAIKRSLKLTVRERLMALEELCKTSEKLASLKKTTR